MSNIDLINKINDKELIRDNTIVKLEIDYRTVINVKLKFIHAKYKFLELIFFDVKYFKFIRF
jgi:hypothetical protein